MKLNVLKNNHSIASYQAAEHSEAVEYYLGRSPDCQIHLDDPKVSRHHGLISHEGGQWIVKNLSSHEKLILNGSPTDKATLQNGDMLIIGDFVISVAEISSPHMMQSQSHLPTEMIQVPSDLEDIANPEQDLEDDFDAHSSAHLSAHSSEPTSEQTLMLDNAEIDPSEDGVALALAEEENFSMDQTQDAFEVAAESTDNHNDSFMPEMMPEMMADQDDQFGSDFPVEDSAGDKTSIFTTFAKFSLKLFGYGIPYDRYLIKDDEVLIGRDPQKVQIPISDGEVSAVHAKVIRRGASLFLEDLNSGNGTLLNGERINSAEIKPGDEFVIGNATFTLEVDSEELAQNAETLMPVERDQEITVEEIIEEEVDDFQPSSNSSEFGMEGGETSKPNFIKANLKRILLYGTVGLLGLLFLLPTSNNEQTVVKSTPQNQQEKNSTNPVVENTPNANVTKTRDYSEEELRFMEARYQAGKALIVQGNYREAIDEFEKIIGLNPDYKQVSTLMSQARQGLARLEEIERERKAELERAERQKKIQGLLEKARNAVEERNIELSQTLFAQILEIDPTNIDVTQLKLEIEAYAKEQARIAEEKALEEAARKRMVDALLPGKTHYLKKEWFKASIKLEDFLRKDGMDEELIKEASEMLAESRKQLEQLVSPLLGKARSLKEAQDFKGAYEVYAEIAQIDPSNLESITEMQNIKELLDTKAMRVYREALISESLSLFEEAKDRLKEVQQIAPVDSEYYNKASEKLKNYIY